MIPESCLGQVYTARREGLVLRLDPRVVFKRERDGEGRQTHTGRTHEACHEILSSLFRHPGSAWAGDLNGRMVDAQRDQGGRMVS